MNSMRIRTAPWLAGCLSIATLSLTAAAWADSPRDGGRDNRGYAARGQVFRSLPREAVPIRYRGNPYYYRGGEWYRPSGSRFVVVGPPLGVVVPFLPGLYTTFWFGGVPYYYANETYYLWRPEVNGYVVTQPPADAHPSSQAPATVAATEPFVYPKNGQSEAQQATDRYECHRWAADQTSFDPTKPGDNPAAYQTSDGRIAYFRALTACLEGRGYSVK
jgi:hypothetical protein